MLRYRAAQLEDVVHLSRTHTQGHAWLFTPITLLSHTAEEERQMRGWGEAHWEHE